MKLFPQRLRSGASAAQSAVEVCQCGHVREAHEHYRRGSECSLCDVRVCGRFRSADDPAD